MLKVNYLDKSDKAECLSDRLQHKGGSATRLWYSLIEKSSIGGGVDARKLKRLGNICQACNRFQIKHFGSNTERSGLTRARLQVRTFERVYLTA